MEEGSSSKSSEIEWYSPLGSGLMGKWLLLSRSTIRRNDVLLGFPFAASFLRQLRFQILRDSNRKYEVFCPLRITPSHLRAEFVCFDLSGCSAPLLESEIRTFLNPKTFQALENLQTDLEIEQVHFSNFPFHE
jgi:hypothetical protein